MKKIIIIASLDKSANENRARQMSSFLEEKYNINIFNTQEHYINLFKPKYFFSSPVLFCIYFIKNKFSSNYPLIEEMKLRRKIFTIYFKKIKPDAVICQNPQDMLSLKYCVNKVITVFDSPTIFYIERKETKEFSTKTLKFIEKNERFLYQNSNIVSFHWHTLFELAKKYKIQINNPIVADWSIGITKKTNKPRNNRIIYIGNLNANWVNRKLLTNLQNKSKIPIDIFSYETPKYKLKTFGYLQDIQEISNYSFGLITINKSKLRKLSFSAKHLEYIKYGLPILCPEWRQDKDLSSATIYYNNNNFNEVVEKYIDKKIWDNKYKSVKRLSQKYTPNKCFTNLEIEINKQLCKKKTV